MLPDRLRGRALRSIVWDDAAVTGTHSEVADIQRAFDAPKPVTIADPAEFLHILSDFCRPVLDEPLRSTLPAVFEGVEPLKVDHG